MLVLTRKYQEKVRIGDNITITVLRTKGKAVRLGIEAPNDVPVIRGELTFESTAAGDETPEPPTSRETTATAVAQTKRAAARRAETSSSWAADSPISQPVSRVGLQRVPRDKVAGMLPQLVSGTGPLRSMMDRR